MLAIDGGGGVTKRWTPPKPAPAPKPTITHPKPYIPPGLTITNAPPAPPPVAPQAQPFNFETDPGVASARAMEQQGLAQLNASLEEARRRAIIQWGDPAFAAQAGFGIDPQAADFAKQNYLSGNAQLARLERQRDLARRALVNRLAGRGLVMSGDLGYGEGEVQREHGFSVYDAQQKLLDYLTGIQRENIDRSAQLRQGTLGAIQSAYDRYTQNPELYTGITGQLLAPPAPPPPPRAPTPPPLPAGLNPLSRLRRLEDGWMFGRGL